MNGETKNTIPVDRWHFERLGQVAASTDMTFFTIDADDVAQAIARVKAVISYDYQDDLRGARYQASALSYGPFLVSVKVEDR